MSSFIQSYSGLAVTPLSLKPEQVRFEDIPHALAQKVRFNGHLREMGYSVAQHCVLGAEYIGGPAKSDNYTVEQARLKLAFLLHEVSEVYLPDIPAPIKPHIRVGVAESGWERVLAPKPWTDLENEHAEAVFTALDLADLLPLLDSDEVHAMDRAMLCTEKRDLRLQETDEQIVAQEKARYSGEPVPGLRITRVWGPTEAKHDFNVLYHYLRKELGR